jgi:hypothetical protein
MVFKLPIIHREQALGPNTASARVPVLTSASAHFQTTHLLDYQSVDFNDVIPCNKRVKAQGKRAQLRKIDDLMHFKCYRSAEQLQLYGKQRGEEKIPIDQYGTGVKEKLPTAAKSIQMKTYLKHRRAIAK